MNARRARIDDDGPAPANLSVNDSVSDSVALPPETSRALVTKSQSNLLVQSFGSNVLYLRPIRSDDFKRWFAPAFSRWLQEAFDSPEQVAAAFNVRNATAWNWWHGDNRASGDTVARMFMTFPEAAAWFLKEWEEH
jgi:hypothetical protein